MTGAGVDARSREPANATDCDPQQDPLRDPIFEGDEYNQLVTLALGLISGSQRLDELLETVIPDDNDPVPANDPVLLAFLGVVALRQQAMGWLAASGDAEEPASDAASAGVGVSLRELLL